MLNLTFKAYGNDMWLIEETKEIARNNPDTGNIEVLTKNGKPLELDEFGLPNLPHFQYRLWLEKYKPVEKRVSEDVFEVVGYKEI